MNKEMQKYVDLWADANESLFIGRGRCAEYGSPEAFIAQEQDTSVYCYRMHQYVKTFNGIGGFSVLYHWYEGKAHRVNTIQSTPGGDLLVNDIAIHAVAFIPIFSSYWNKANPSISLEKFIENNQTRELENKTKDISIEKDASYYTPCSEINNNVTYTTGKTKMENIKQDAKSSITLAADLAKGRTALAAVHGLITKVLPMKFSWFARLTGKDKAIVESPYTKLAGAAVAHALALQFDNAKVARVTKLAQDAALVEVAGLIPIEEFMAKLTDIKETI